MNSAIISDDLLHRFCLERAVQVEGNTIAYIGVNPSTADASTDDHTSAKWIGFTMLNGGRRYLTGNLFSYRSLDVSMLRYLPTEEAHRFDENDEHLLRICDAADIIVPCWGSMQKVPKRLRHRADDVLALLRSTGKPLYHLGFCKDGNPRHVLMLSYDTPFTLWQP